MFLVRRTFKSRIYDKNDLCHSKYKPWCFHLAEFHVAIVCDNLHKQCSENLQRCSEKFSEKSNCLNAAVKEPIKHLQRGMEG